jgi:putative endonuclease
MPLFSRLVFSLVEWAARKGLAADASSVAAAPSKDSSAPSPERLARRATGLRGETFAYWYLRRHGYTIIARNFTVPGLKGELDLVGYDGPVLAFIEVKTRTGQRFKGGLPEDAVTPEKRRLLSRMARQFLAERRIREAACRFDVLAIESAPGVPPVVRLHRGAFADR